MGGVYAKTPLAGPAAVLDYLSRYTHRTAVGQERIVAVRDDGVRLRVRAAGDGKKTVRIAGAEFVVPRLFRASLICGGRLGGV
jgi:hypothetical protein